MNVYLLIGRKPSYTFNTGNMIRHFELISSEEAFLYVGFRGTTCNMPVSATTSNVPFSIDLLRLFHFPTVSSTSYIDNFVVIHMSIKNTSQKFPPIRPSSFTTIQNTEIDSNVVNFYVFKFPIETLIGNRHERFCHFNYRTPLLSVEKLRPFTLAL